MNIAAIGAHPDDLELLCAGTLAKYTNRGDKVTMIICCNGELGSSIHSKEEISKIRHEEALESASIIGANLEWLGYPDEFLYDTREVRLAILNVLRKSKAEVVFAHYPSDLYFPDHYISGQIVNDIGIIQTVKNVETEYPPTENNPFLYFMDTIAGIKFDPDEYVDITETFEIKKKMLLTHRSQADWLRHHSKITYEDLIETQAKFRGYQCGVKYAEGFIGVKAWPRTRVGSLLP
ncbi:MAG: PIG-L family deacetylase [Actinobacteria bacterium]|nr:PIG-L family deacetylase [Actinomycetota bacterium]